MTEIDYDDVTRIGPGCFIAADDSVINWQGVNYVPQTADGAGDKLLGFDVNDFQSATYYAIFNDPDAPELVNLPEALRELLTQAALYEDESLDRTIQHARLMNEDRARGQAVDGTLRSPVKVKTQTVLRTPWADVPLEDA